MTAETLSWTDVITLLSALTIASERLPNGPEYEDMRQRILKASTVTIEADTP